MTIQPDPDNWRTSSYSGGSENCVEVAGSKQVVLVRDSKDKAGGTLRLSPAGWSQFASVICADITV